jgi:2-polyprenyl-3-methyl-5-hydroxy-6-metoxy-1,4-benzoquinol methylase
MTSLPKWTDHPGHSKREPLTGPGPAPEPVVRRWLTDRSREQETPLRVLDVGAGRGGLVAWLLDQGYDAVGVEIDAGYVDNGRAYLPHNRLLAIDPGGTVSAAGRLL